MHVGHLILSFHLTPHIAKTNVNEPSAHSGIQRLNAARSRLLCLMSGDECSMLSGSVNMSTAKKHKNDINDEEEARPSHGKRDGIEHVDMKENVISEACNLA